MKIKPFTLSLPLVLAACQEIKHDDGSSANLSFTEAPSSVIAFDDVSRRKWDAPVIVDLDQDGWQDLIVTEHAHNVRVYWNNEGAFTEQTKIMGGDTHGAGAGDLDNNGLIDVIIAPGGGGGKKPKYPVTFEFNKKRQMKKVRTYDHFERIRGRAAKLIDSDADGQLDLVLSTFPLPKKRESPNFLYANQGDGQYQLKQSVANAQRHGDRTLVTDVNNDGYVDLVLYAGADMIVVKGGSDGKLADATAEVLGELRNTDLVSSVAEIDYDNDGDFDLFLTRAEHPFDRQTYFDEEFGRYAFFTRLKEFQFEDIKVNGDLHIENLQMAFPHTKVFAGEAMQEIQLEGSVGSERTVRLSQEQAKGWPQSQKEPGLYIGYVGDNTWRLGGMTKSPTAGVVHNVISKPETDGRKPMQALLFENQNGRFVDATEKLGLNLNEQATGIAVGDFNSDGWQDIFVVRYGFPARSTHQIVLLNNKGQGFEALASHGVISKELGATGSGAETLDYDKDGDLDLIYANERGRWHLFTNNIINNGQNNYVVINIGRSPKTKSTAQAALLTVNACNTKYVRRVGATASISSTSLNLDLHIGLGPCNKLDSANVTWSNGETQAIEVGVVNTHYEAGFKRKSK